MNNEEIFNCNTCGKIFRSKKGYDGHVNSTACKEAKFLCEYCNNKFTSKNSMNRHIKTNCLSPNNPNTNKSDAEKLYIKLKKEMEKQKKDFAKEKEDLKKQITELQIL